MEFEWDKAKAAANVKKHGIPFDAKIMKKTQAAKKRKASDELRREYRLDYGKSKPNRFAAAATEGRAVVVLDPDIAEVFTTPESVNNVLRALITTMPRGQRRKVSGR